MSIEKFHNWIEQEYLDRRSGANEPLEELCESCQGEGILEVCTGINKEGVDTWEWQVCQECERDNINFNDEIALQELQDRCDVKNGTHDFETGRRREERQ